MVPDVDRFDMVVSNLEFYFIVAVLTIIMLVMLIKRPRTLVQWAIFCKTIAFNIIIWTLVWLRAHHQLFLPQPYRIIVNTICVILLGYAVIVLVAYYSQPMFRDHDRSDDLLNSGKE